MKIYCPISQKNYTVKPDNEFGKVQCPLCGKVDLCIVEEEGRHHLIRTEQKS